MSHDLRREKKNEIKKEKASLVATTVFRTQFLLCYIIFPSMM